MTPSKENIEEIITQFNWDLTGDSPDNPRNKYFFEADAEKILIALQKKDDRAKGLEAKIEELEKEIQRLQERTDRLP